MSILESKRVTHLAELLGYWCEEMDGHETVSGDIFGRTEVVDEGEFGVEGEPDVFAGFGQSQSLELEGDWEQSFLINIVGFCNCLSGCIILNGKVIC